jgi:hypothetical protein
MTPAAKRPVFGQGKAGTATKQRRSNRAPAGPSGVTELPNGHVRIPLDCLSEYLDEHDLVVVDGDPDLYGNRGGPRILLAPRAADR